MENRTPQAKSLVSSAMLMAVTGGLVTTLNQTAVADLGDIPLLAGATVDGLTLYSTMSGIHTFGATENFYAPASAYFITVNSGSLGGDDFYVNIDWAPFDPGYFVPFGINYVFLSLDLKDAAGGGNALTDLVVTDGAGGNPDLDAGGLGLFSFDGFSLTINLDTTALVNAGSTTNITFSQIPAPGTLALLGLAGLAGTRRRRR